MITLFCGLNQNINLFQNGLDTKIEKSRKQMKERKNRAKKIRGVKKVILQLVIVVGLWLLTPDAILVLLNHKILFVLSLQTKASDAAKAGKKKWVLRLPVFVSWLLLCFQSFLIPISSHARSIEWDILVQGLILVLLPHKAFSNQIMFYG